MDIHDEKSLLSNSTMFARNYEGRATFDDGEYVVDIALAYEEDPEREEDEDYKEIVALRARFIEKLKNDYDLQVEIGQGKTKTNVSFFYFK